MDYTDIAIIGGGLAGSTAAPCSVEQVGRFYETGIADSVLRSATHDGENWIARFGYLLHKRPSHQYGIMYDDLIAAIRAEIPPPGCARCASTRSRP